MIVPLYAIGCDAPGCAEMTEAYRSRWEAREAAELAGWVWTAFGGHRCARHTDLPRRPSP